MLTINRIVKLKGVIKWSAVFAEAGLNPNTMRSAIHNHRDLRREEAAAIYKVLRKHGIHLDAPPEISLFSNTEMNKSF